jgi:hypothetical protein
MSLNLSISVWRAAPLLISPLLVTQQVWAKPYTVSGHSALALSALVAATSPALPRREKE